jgi:hypothetical protein
MRLVIPDRINFIHSCRQPQAKATKGLEVLFRSRVMTPLIVQKNHNKGSTQRLNSR